MYEQDSHINGRDWIKEIQNLPSHETTMQQFVENIERREALMSES